MPTIITGALLAGGTAAAVAAPLLPALIGVAGAKKSSGQAASAATSAAATQAQAADRATQEQQRQFDVTQEQFAPFREAGVGALTEQQALLGLSGSGAQQEAFGRFAESPGQAFLRQRGEQSLLRNQAAIGGLGGGNVRSALQQQGIGFAQQDLQNQLARLSAISGSGQAATQNVAQLGAQTASNVGNLMTQSGQATAGGILGAGQAQQQFTNQLTGVGVGAAAGSGLAGSRAQAGFGGSTGAGALLGLL